MDPASPWRHRAVPKRTIRQDGHIGRRWEGFPGASPVKAESSPSAARRFLLAAGDSSWPSTDPAEASSSQLQALVVGSVPAGGKRAAEAARRQLPPWAACPRKIPGHGTRLESAVR
jgi:hypothetical protein